MGKQSVREGMARFAIPSDNAFGVAVGEMRNYAKEIGRNHELAAELWEAGWYEARMLACFVDDPKEVTPTQMDRWAKDFDSWAICDTACFHLFDRTPHAWSKVRQWAKRKDEFVRRASFALLASLALHEKKGPDEPFAEALALIERYSDDDRNFVKKAINWALRAVGQRSRPLHAASVALAQKLAVSETSCTRWIAKDALRELNGPVVAKRLKNRMA
jgi:Predicted DNA alkylation repair enzyme